MVFFDASRWTIVGASIVGIAASFFVAGHLDLVSYRNESTGALFPSVVAAVGFLPLAILLSYTVRISTIVSRMPLLNPFLANG